MYLKLLVYGPYGSGKTTLAASADDVEGMAPIFYIDVEAGDTALRNRPTLDRVGVTSVGQLNKVLEFLRLHCRLRRDPQQAGSRERLAELESSFRGETVLPENVTLWNTVAIDSMSEVHKLMMYQLLGIQTTNARIDVEPAAPEFKEWGSASEMLRILIRSLRDLPLNTIFVCPEQESEDESGGRKRLVKKPNLPGKLSGDVQGFVDMVGYLALANSEEGQRRRLYIQPGPTFAAKNRFSQVKVPFIDEPTMAQIYGLAFPEKASR